jgi:CRISPR-associated protein Cmr2
MTNHYLGLTIGPILSTLQQARKTRELWAASYLLSYLMKLLTEELDPEGNKILIPVISDDTKKAKVFGAGIYPDKLYMPASSLGDDLIKAKKAVDDCIAKALDRLAVACLVDLSRKQEATEFWKQFFRIRYTILEIKDISKGNLSFELTPILDSMELEDVSFAPATGKDFLLQAFQSIFKISLADALKKDAGSYRNVMPSGHLFPSTSDVGTFELFQKENSAMHALDYKYDSDDHDVFYQKIQEHPILRKLFRQRHKYFCLVQADGDFMSKAIQKINRDTEYQTFSTELAAYGAKAAGIINDFGGKPIYIGGDDLLFLSPISNGEANVFNLIEQLNQAFPPTIQGVPVSVSFGLSIVYYKFPLFEAIEDAYKILHQAKDFVDLKGNLKNAVSVRFTKHSGSEFECTFSKVFLGKIQEVVTAVQNADGERDTIVSSLIFKLQTLEKVFTSILSLKTDVEPRLRATMLHFFNEWKDEQFDAQREAIMQLLIAAKDDVGTEIDSKTNKSKAIALFYNSVRLVQFMIAPDKTTDNNDL